MLKAFAVFGKIITVFVIITIASIADILANPASYEQGERRYYNVTIPPRDSIPSIIGETIRDLVEKADYNPKRELTIFPKFLGLRAMPISIMSDEAMKTFPDRESDIISSDELWHNSEIGNDHLYRDREIFAKADSSKNLDKDHPFFFSFKIETLTDYVSTPHIKAFLQRSSATGEVSTPILIDELVMFAGLRLNMSNNLVPFACHEECDKGLIREDEYYFASIGMLPDKLFLGLVKTLKPNIHAYIGGGYSEEMFAGFSTEILYRPYDKNYALSVEAHRLYKRNPFSKMALQLEEKAINTAFVNFNYEFPKQELLIKASAGRYLGEDIGAEINFNKKFPYDISLEGFIRYSNKSEQTLSGGKSNINSGVKLSFPLNYVTKLPKKMRDYSAYEIKFSPFGRRYGERASPPVNLYEMTDNFSKYRISEAWYDIIPRLDIEK